MNEPRGLKLSHLLAIIVVVGTVLAILVPYKRPRDQPIHSSNLNPATEWEKQVAASSPATPPHVNLLAVDGIGYERAIAALKGKVILVDFWATWCEPCVAQLPHTLALGEELRGRGLAVVTVSCDERSGSDKIVAFLKSKNAGGATNLISQFGGSPQTMEELEVSNGAVPFYKLYDRTGKLRQSFGISPKADKQFSTADIDVAVSRLLAE